MHADSGQVALRLAGLDEPFFAIARPAGQDWPTLDKTGAVLHEKRAAPDDRGRPEMTGVICAVCCWSP